MMKEVLSMQKLKTFRIVVPFALFFLVSCHLKVSNVFVPPPPPLSLSKRRASGSPGRDRFLLQHLDQTYRGDKNICTVFLFFLLRKMRVDLNWSSCCLSQVWSSTQVHLPVLALALLAHIVPIFHASFCTT